jgi:hypothetical protein
MTGRAISNVMMIIPGLRHESSFPDAQLRIGESITPAMMMKAGLGPIRLLRAEAAFCAPLQRKNPPRISADGFQAKQFTVTKTHHETGPVKR